MPNDGKFVETKKERLRLPFQLHKLDISTPVSVTTEQIRTQEKKRRILQTSKRHDNFCSRSLGDVVKKKDAMTTMSRSGKEIFVKSIKLRGNK